jgi:hypothetical protein
MRPLGHFQRRAKLHSTVQRTTDESSVFKRKDGAAQSPKRLQILCSSLLRVKDNLKRRGQAGRGAAPEASGDLVTPQHEHSAVRIENEIGHLLHKLLLSLD